MFWVFQKKKKSFIKKSMEQLKNKEGKERYQTNVSYIQKFFKYV